MNAYLNFIKVVLIFLKHERQRCCLTSGARKEKKKLTKKKFLQWETFAEKVGKLFGAFPSIFL